MNGGLAMPQDVAQQQAMQQMVEQNNKLAAMQARTNALGLAVQLASAVPDHSSITKILANAAHMSQFIESGEVAAKAVE